MKQNPTTNGVRAKGLCLVVILALTLVILTSQVWAEDTENTNIVASWQIGGDGKTEYQEAAAKDNVMATLYENGELRITGAGDIAPFNLKSYAPWYENYRNAITKIIFEEGVEPTSLSYFAYGCGELETAPEIPNSVLNLDNMFRSCVKLKTAPEVPKGVTNMRGTFNSCKELTNAPQIPDSVKNMDSTFYGCSKLASAPEIPSSVTYLRGLFTGCRALKTAPQIPEGITIMQNVFYGCSSLEAAPQIPGSVTDMQSAFRDCSALKGEMKINAANVSTYNDCFLNAATDGGQLVLKYNFDSEGTVDKLLTTKSVNSDIVKYVSKNPVAAWNIGGDGIKGYNAATAKDNVKATLYDDGELRISGEGNTVVFNTDAPWIKNYKNQIKKITFESGVRPTDLSCFAYQCNSLISVSEIPDSVTKMEKTFRECTSLETAPEIPCRVTNMHQTFYGCTSIEAAPRILGSVTNLQYAFYQCLSLETAPVIPDSVTDMSYAIYGCISLKTAPDIPKNVTNMVGTFGLCYRLKGEMKINAVNLNLFGNCFDSAAIGSGQLKLNYGPGALESVNKLLTSKSAKSKIVIGTEKADKL